MMLRNILAAIVGCVAMAVVLFAPLWLTVGGSRVFEPGSWEVPGGWVLVQLVLGLLGAWFGSRRLRARSEMRPASALRLCSEERLRIRGDTGGAPRLALIAVTRRSSGNVSSPSLVVSQRVMADQRRGADLPWTGKG